MRTDYAERPGPPAEEFTDDCSVPPPDNTMCYTRPCAAS